MVDQRKTSTPSWNRGFHRNQPGTTFRRTSKRDKTSNAAEPNSRKRGSDQLQDKIEEAKRRLSERNVNTKTQDKSSKATDVIPSGTKGGLNVELHPLLRNMAVTPTIPKNYNPLKPKIRDLFDSNAMNPYLDQSSMGPSSHHKGGALKFNPQGKYIEKANELRQKQREEDTRNRKLEEMKSKGLTANEELGEHLFKPEFPPIVEWWDKPYLKDVTHGYTLEDFNIQLDSEVAPVSIYIQHPVLLEPIWEKHLDTQKSMYLTKKERKRIRKNDRQEKLKDQQDRIRLGLEPPPPPKIKLSNLMNVLTNESIKDPTSVEMRVRKEVEERYQKHMKENEDRKLSKEQRHEKNHLKHEKDLKTGYFTSIYKIQSLLHPQHFFKVDINAKQLELVGICLLNPRFNLIIVQGGQKSIKFYKKLLTRRINWQQQDTDSKAKADGEHEENKCTIIWEGQVKNFNFKKWSIIRTNNDDEVFDVLNKFGVENYWREALALEND